MIVSYLRVKRARKCWNWQTGKTKDLVLVTTCGFKSHLPQIMSRAKSSAFCLQKYRRTLVLARKSVPYFLQMERSISFFLFGEYCEMSKSAALQITDTVAIVIVHKRIYIRYSFWLAA